jgi:uncharacterized protein (TIGR03435 family)
MRRDLKEQPVYAVVPGKGALKLQKTKLQEKDCVEDAAGVNPCHRLVGGMGRGLHGKAVTIADIASFVENWTDRPVVDKSGLKDLYEIDTDGWTPMVGPADAGSDEGLNDPTRPTLFMVFEKIGLKLEAQRAAVETFTIEHLERPTGN